MAVSESLPSFGPGRPARPGRSLRERAIASLARRDYSRSELRRKLLAGNVDTAETLREVDALLDALEAEGYLSDGRYAASLVARKAGQWSRRAIVDELRAKGVTSQATAAALEDLPGEDGPALVALWRRRFGAPPRDDRDKARQIRFLQSRGFRLSEILRLLRSPPPSDDPDGA